MKMKISELKKILEEQELAMGDVPIHVRLGNDSLLPFEKQKHVGTMKYMNGSKALIFIIEDRRQSERRKSIK